MTKRGNAVRRVVVALLMSVAVASCLGHSSSRQFSTELHRADETTPFPVVLSDETGLVTGIESAPLALGDDVAPIARADPADPNAFFVSWLGGACDNDAALTFKPLAGGYTVNVTVHGKFGFPGGCTAVGIPRDVRILTSSPIPIDSIVAAGGI
jgi:hypothetical protein